jgi:uncharacterized protein (TIGR00255 family)
MIASMTGFGQGTATRDEATARVELRSVNKRHIDISIRADALPADLEARIESRLKDAFERGRLTVSITVDAPQQEALDIEVDTQAALAYRDLLDRLRTAAQIQEPVRLDHLLAFEDEVFSAAEATEPELSEPTEDAVLGALDAAVDALRSMRQQEGAALRTDLLERIDAIETHLDAVVERAPTRVEERQARLQERLTELVDSDRIDPDRLETELAIVADKLDVTEECVRLRSHLDMFREACNDDEPTGRRLKFITQEIHREVNTIGAKANDETISRHGVQMKEEVEKIREQIRNVE